MKRIQEEIERLTRNIENDTIRIGTLKSLLPKELSQQTPQVKPSGFVLTEAILKVLEAHRGQSSSLDDIYADIVRNSGGYNPNKKSVAINLSVWTKNGTVKKTDRGYMIAE